MNPQRILVVDDDEAICTFVCDAAEDMGLIGAYATAYEKFDQTLEAFDPDIIMLDLRMPDRDGVEYLRQLARNGSSANIYLISGMDMKVLNTAAELGSKYGLNIKGTIQKPFEIEDLEKIFISHEPEAAPLDESQLRTAIAERQIRVFYQPKIDLKSPDAFALDSVEALVRWEHPDRGLVGPDAFIPLAETTGLIGELTDFVLGETFSQLSAWRKSGHTFGVAVNISARLLEDLSLPDRISDLLRDADLLDARLLLEITESAAMDDADKTLEILTRFRLKNIEVSLDDFGTGYSSLVQLHRMPFSELKIDKSFVMAIGTSDEAKVIVKAVTELAHNLNLSVCAEGVETEEALEFLKSIGCDKAQGYYFSRPVPAGELIAFVENRRSVK